MTPPITAKDPEEGFCLGCQNWASWDELEPCSTCNEPMCSEHRCQEDHPCVEAER